LTTEALQTATDEQNLANIAAVLDYLTDAGWKVTRASLYRHHKEAKILPGKDGIFTREAVDKYAKNFLKQKATGKKVNDALDELQRKKLERELQIQDLEYERKKFAHEKDLGKFIPRELMDIELAARAGILDAGLKHWIQSRAADWIRTVTGDTKLVGEMINLMNRDLDEHINNYANTKEYQVIFDAGEEMPDESEKELDK
jgi:hypothetical protein